MCVVPPSLQGEKNVGREVLRDREGDSLYRAIDIEICNIHNYKIRYCTNLNDECV